MRGHRKRPLDFEIRTNAYYEDSIATLRNAVIRRVDRVNYDFIMFILAGAFSVGTFQTRPMLCPLFDMLFLDLRTGKLKTHVFQVCKMTLPEQAPYVLKDKSSRPQIAHCPHCFREHVSFISTSQRLPSQGEWLTGRSATY